MPESQSPKPVLRKAVTIVFVLLSVVLFFTDHISPETYKVFVLIPTLLLIFIRRLDIVIAIQLVVVALWLIRHFFLDLTPSASNLFGLVYYAAIAAMLVGFKLVDIAANGRKRATKRDDARS